MAILSCSLQLSEAEMNRLLGYRLLLGHCSKPGPPPPKPGARADLTLLSYSLGSSAAVEGSSLTERPYLETAFEDSSSANRISYRISWLLNPGLRVLMRREHTPEPWHSSQCSGHTYQAGPHSSCLGPEPPSHKPPYVTCSCFSLGPFTLFLNLESCLIIY